MNFAARLSELAKELEISAAMNDAPDVGEEWQSIVFCRGAKRVVLPCRIYLPADADTAALLYSAFHTCQVFGKCDDFLEWAGIYELEPGDTKAWHEFRALDAAQWQFRDLLGEELFRELMTGMEIEQAIGAAAAGFHRSEPDS
mgnify:CR=1 FL=1|jgi:hypothetical protein